MNGKGIHRSFLIGIAIMALLCDSVPVLARTAEQPTAKLIVKASPNAALASKLTLDSKALAFQLRRSSVLQAWKIDHVEKAL